MSLGKKNRQADDRNRRESQFVYAVWKNAESEDPNLSRIEVPGTDGADPNHIRWVPKLAHVTGLSDGDTVLCVKQPYIIIGIAVGDITLAEVND